MANKPILAFDCSTSPASVALQVDGQVAVRSIAQGQQAGQLVPAIDALLKEKHISYKNISCFVTTVGPGSFTGLRIALATLHGLALATGIPVKTLTSLQAVAHDVAADDFIVALNAGKGEVFAQRFIHHTAEGDMMVVKPEAVLSQALPVYGNLHDAAHAHYLAGPNAATLCRIADSLSTTSLLDAAPIYIRPPDIKLAAPLPWLQTA